MKLIFNNMYESKSGKVKPTPPLIKSTKLSVNTYNCFDCYYNPNLHTTLLVLYYYLYVVVCNTLEYDDMYNDNNHDK